MIIKMLKIILKFDKMGENLINLLKILYGDILLPLCLAISFIDSSIRYCIVSNHTDYYLKIVKNDYDSC